MITWAEFDWARALRPPQPSPFRERDDEIIEMRRAGLTYKQIADHWGISRCRAGQIVNDEFDQYERQMKEPLRGSQNTRFSTWTDGAERNARVNLKPYGVERVLVAIDMLLEGQEQ